MVEQTERMDELEPSKPSVKVLATPAVRLIRNSYTSSLPLSIHLSYHSITHTLYLYDLGPSEPSDKVLATPAVRLIVILALYLYLSI